MSKKGAKPGKNRRKARELALKGLYQWRLSGADIPLIEATLREDETFGEADETLLKNLLEGVVKSVEILGNCLAPCLDRGVADLSPIEYAVLLIGAYELTQKPDVPYRDVINEAVDLAKHYGGTDGHKFVNGVLDKLALAVRPDEVRLRSQQVSGPRRN